MNAPRPPVFATLPILDGEDAEGIEVVRTCHRCGEKSSASLEGAARWTYWKTGPFGLKDICPTCSDPKPTNMAAEEWQLHPAQRKFYEETEKKR